MTKKIMFLTILGLLHWQCATACDACGCSISGNGLGLLTAYRSNFIGFSWQRSVFHGSPEHSGSGKDYFHTLELSARYHITDRWKILLNQPYRINQRKLEGQTDGIHGWSDTRILASYTFSNQKKIGEETSLFFELAGGVKLPVGKYDADLHETDLPENFNISNGSWGYILQPNLVLNHQKSGFVLGGLYQYFDKTNDGYHFGSQFSTNLLAFHQVKLSDNTKLIPNVGISAEWIGEDQFANEKTVNGTGGNGIFVNAGINLQLKKFLVGISYAQPISQSYSHGEVEAGGRIACQFSYLF